MLTRSERVDKLQFAESDPNNPHRTLYIAAAAAVLFIAANVVSLVLCLHQETTFPFFRLNYTSVIWNQFAWLTTSTITLMYTLARQRTTAAVKVAVDDDAWVEAADGNPVHEIDNVSNLVGSVLTLITRGLFSPFLLGQGLRKLLHFCIEQVSYFAESQYLQWDIFCTDEALEYGGFFQFVYYIIKQLIAVPLLIAFVCATHVLKALRALLFLLTKPMHDKLPTVLGRLDYRNMFLLIGTACLIAQVTISSQHLSEPARVEFSNMAARAGYHLHWPAGPSFLDNPFKLYEEARANKYYLQVVACVFFVFALYMHHPYLEVWNIIRVRKCTVSISG